jgi:hypothetical protein
MKEFTVGHEPPALPVGMKIIGVGVILSCLMLSALFGWGIYLNLTREPATGAEGGADQEASDDVAIADGVLTRKNPPAFSIDIPETMKNRPKSPGQLYSGGQNVSPFSLQVAVYDLGEDGFDAWVKSAGENWTAVFRGMGSASVEIVSVNPTDMYGKFQAVEMVIEWLWTDGSTELTNINHYILKGDKVISLSSTLTGNPRQATEMYETIDLDP